MPGLLDSFFGNADQTRAMGLLGAQMMAGNTPQGLLMANEYLAGAPERNAKQQFAQLQMQEAQQRMEEAQRQRQFLQNLPTPPAGPSGQVAPGMDFVRQAVQAGVIKPEAYLSAFMPKQLEFGKVDPKDYTPESLQVAQATGDYTKLVPVRKNEIAPNGQVYNPYQIQPGQTFADPNKPFAIGASGGMVPNQPYQDYEVRKAKAGATNVNVDTAPKAFWGDFGRSASDALFKEREGAQAAAGVLQSVNEIRQAVAGGAYQGAGAEMKLGAAKALNALGANIDPKTVANSEVFNAHAKQFVLGQIKMLGANPSNADREFIEKTVPSLSTDPSALPRLIQFMESKARQQVEGYNNKIRNVQRQPGAGFMPFSLEVQAPQPAQPAPTAPQANLRWDPKTRTLQPVN